jgi:hypothetical protein
LYLYFSFISIALAFRLGPPHNLTYEAEAHQNLKTHVLTLGISLCRLDLVTTKAFEATAWFETEWFAGNLGEVQWEHT